MTSQAPSERTAVHEAGHAAAAFLHAATVEFVTALPKGRRRGQALIRGGGCDVCNPLVGAIVCLAGPAAEALHAGYRFESWTPSASPGDDRDSATKLIASIAHSRLEFEAVLDWLEIRCRALVSTPRFRALTDALVHELLEHGELTGEAATAVLQRADDAHERQALAAMAEPLSGSQEPDGGEADFFEVPPESPSPVARARRAAKKVGPCSA